ncbi:hypothetical protein HJFPF1_02290 [Paramyrothecium foliicola]|nr:hypothetical protein HJFPF1_02290 [Paramyrothecium foliicola]
MDTFLKEWRRQGYLLSTDRRLIDVNGFAAAMRTDLLWWAKPLPEDAVQKAINNSLCFGLYKVDNETPTATGENSFEMIGLVRLVTDFVTLGYLSDVYVVPEQQGKGLGVWMMQCVNETLEGWPHLRRVLLVTSSPTANKFYERTLGAQEWTASTTDLDIMQKQGSGGVSSHK